MSLIKINPPPNYQWSNRHQQTQFHTHNVIGKKYFTRGVLEIIDIIYNNSVITTKFKFQGRL